jgi:hypothetical protein
MVNVLFANNLKEANAARAAGQTAVVGAAAGSGGGGRDALLGAVAGAVIGGTIGKLTEDEVYRMVVDVVIKEKVNRPVKTAVSNSIGQVSVTNQRRAGFANEFAGPLRSKNEAGKLHDNINENVSQEYKTNYIEKRTRVFAEATKMNLKLAEALPILENKISKSIAGLF